MATVSQTPQSPKAPRLLQNALANWVVLCINGLVGFIVAPVLLKNLGATQYGLWVTLVSIAGQFTVLDLGLRSSLVRFVSEALAKNNHESLAETINSAKISYVFASLLTALLGAVVLLLLGSNSKVPPELLYTARIVLTVLLVDSISEIIAGVWEGSLAGSENYAKIAKANFLRLILYSAVIAWVVIRQSSLITLALGVVGARIAQRLMLRHFAKSSVGRVNFIFPSLEAYKRVIFYSTSAFFVSLALRIIHTADLVVVGLVLGPTFAAIYAIPLILIENFRTFAQAGATVLTPRFAALASTDQKSLAESTMLRGICIFQLFCGCVVAGLILSGGDFILLWTHQSLPESNLILTILAVPLICVIPAMFLSSYLYGTSKPRLLAVYLGTEAILNLAASLLLVKPYGLLGVAIGTAIPAIIMRGILLPFCVLPILSISRNAYFLEGIIKPLPSVATYSLFIFWYKQQGFLLSWIGFVSGHFIALLLAALVAWVLVLKPEERLRFLRLLKPQQPIH